jgi:hypothetical protein
MSSRADPGSPANGSDDLGGIALAAGVIQPSDAIERLRNCSRRLRCSSVSAVTTTVFEPQR